MSDKIREMVELLKTQTEKQSKVSTLLVTVVSVDWEAKTMVGKGVTDGLENFDVLLGLGSLYRKPKIDKLALIGIIENKNTETFLIEAEELEAIELNSVEITINGGLNDGLVKVQALVERLNGIEDKLNDTISNWNEFCASYTPGSPSAVGTPPTLATAVLTPVENTTQAQIENDKVKH